MVGGFEGVIFILSDFEIDVQKLVYGGEGLGRLEGRAVLAPFVLPGERARVRGVSEKPGLVRAGLLEVLAAAPERVAPPCPYFMRCGGCQYQHAPYEMQLALKRGILEDQLRRIGKIASPPEIAVVAGEPWGYRNRVQLHIAKGALASAGVPYRNAPTPSGPANVRVGAETIVSPDGTSLDAAAFKAAKAKFTAQLKAALTRAGYPASAKTSDIDIARTIEILLVFVVAAAALYGPQAAALVELFPTRIRYTALSVPYHIGVGWFGGFLPTIAFAIVVATGNIYAGLWYPAAIAAIGFVVTLFFLPETRGRDIEA